MFDVQFSLSGQLVFDNATKEAPLGTGERGAIGLIAVIWTISN